MNKVVLVAGGTAVVSLAAGAAGGYFFAKNKLGKEFDARLTEEIDATKRHYALIQMERDSGKPDSPLDIPLRDEDEELLEEGVPETDPVVEEKAKQALVDYQGVSSKSNVFDKKTEIAKSNVFDKKPELPPRDDNGRFVPRQTPDEERVPAPYLIEPDEYLANAVEHHQDEMLRWYADEETLVNHGDEEVDIDWVGMKNLELHNFPQGDENGGGRHIYVRNEGMKEDFQIQLCGDSLAESAGFGDAYSLDEV
jgi:hypothetical protein